MYDIPSGGGCFCPVQPPVCYGTGLTEEGEWMQSLEVISIERNGFGDMYYYIRDQNGVTIRVYEGDLESFMKNKGIFELKEGVSFLYPKKN